MNANVGIGAAINRVDGRLKVTGQAKYAGEFFPAEPLLYGVIVPSEITKGRILTLDTKAAQAVPGVVTVMTHRNRPPVASRDENFKDEVAPPGSPFRALYDDKIMFAEQPIALIVADTFQTAIHAASLVAATYESESHNTSLAAALPEASPPQKGRHTPRSRGDAQGALARAPFTISGEYHLAPEHHNPMEPFASTVIWEGDGKLTIHDKTQGSRNVQRYICAIFDLPQSDVRVASPFVGGGFGSGLRPQHQVYLATMAAILLKRSVRVTMSRRQMFTHGYRPECIQRVSLGAASDGKLIAIINDGTTTSSRFERFAEIIVNWGAMLYRCDNAQLEYKIAPVDTYTTCDMRAPGAATGVTLFEIAMDELAYKLDIDPLDFRLRNYSDREEIENKPYTSKALRACYEQGAARFGWSGRSMAPRSMRDGKELVGWGMATGIWEALMMPTSARAKLTPDGCLEVSSSMADIGTGTYTVVTQVAAETLGISLDRITAKLGDSSLPDAPVEGGSWAAASVGAAVKLACNALREELLGAAKRLENSPVANANNTDVIFEDGLILLATDRSKSVSIGEVLKTVGPDGIEATRTASPDLAGMKDKARNTHSAIFSEVKVDEELGVVRVTRIVNAVAAGRIINPKTARSQILGGVVFGLGMALEEETMFDHRLGRIMNHSLGEYHVPVNADIYDIDVIFVEEVDSEVSPLGVKGVGEIGIVGTAAAIANAIYHATGKRIRDLPITIDKILAA